MNPLLHWVDPDQLTGPRGLARAACGAFVYPNEQVMHGAVPTCQKCAAFAEDREADIIAFLHADNDVRRI